MRSAAAALADEAQPTRREQVQWVVLGVGVTFVVYDSVFLQLPWWVASQPEGLRLGATISLVANIALCSAVPAVLLVRTF
jgi:hypothetical protein